MGWGCAGQHLGLTEVYQEVDSGSKSTSPFPAGQALWFRRRRGCFPCFGSCGCCLSSEVSDSPPLA